MAPMTDEDNDGAPIYRLCVKCQTLKAGTMYSEGQGTVCESCR